ncbi:MAG: hypothetical protein ABW321_32660 [Polyangiales bacterium]
MQVIGSESGAAVERVGLVLKSRYRIDRVIHTAADADVYGGTDLKGGRVAIKCLRAEHATDVAARTRWVRRASLANSVGHSGAVSVIDDGLAADGVAFVVTELLEAQSLEQLRNDRGGRLPTRLVCGIADQCLDLLGSAHAQEVTHGQLDTRNVFWTRSGQLKVLGFGATPACPQHPNEPCPLACVVRRDLRATAALLFLLLHGEPLHEVAAAQPGVSIASLLPSVPPAIGVVIERALVSDAAQRWTHADEMRAALQLAFASALGAPLDHALQPMAATHAPESPAWAWPMVALVGGALVAWIMWLPLGSDHLERARHPEARVHEAREASHTSETPDTKPAAEAAVTAAETRGLMPDAAQAPHRSVNMVTSVNAATSGDVIARTRQAADTIADEAKAEVTVKEAPAPAGPNERARKAPKAGSYLRIKPSEPKPGDTTASAPARHDAASQLAPTDRLCAQLNERKGAQGAPPELGELWSQHCSQL